MCSIPSCGPSISSSGCGAMLRCWPETRGTAGRVERMIPMRRIAGAVAALVLAGTAPLVAQYFGQNKVQYRTFDFQIIQTEHFEVYYYPAERVAALDAARIAERWYARLSRVLHHEFQGRKPIILYASQSDFQQTNIVDARSEEHTSELQSLAYLVCRLLLEKKKKHRKAIIK